MSELVRMSISIERPLLDRLEALVDERGYANRSEFVRDLVRKELVSEEWEQDREALGTVTLIYNHHKRQLGEKLTDIQHHHHDLIMATTHIHLDHDLCAEMIMVRGPAEAIRSLASMLHQQKGVLHAALSMSTTGKKLA